MVTSTVEHVAREIFVSYKSVNVYKLFHKCLKQISVYR